MSDTCLFLLDLGIAVTFLSVYICTSMELRSSEKSCKKLARNLCSLSLSLFLFRSFLFSFLDIRGKINEATNRKVKP